MILASALGSREPRATGWSPMDDRWYAQDFGGSPGGLHVTPETMLRCSTVLAAVRFLATSVALCRPQVVRYVGTERRVEPGHYAQRLLRNPHPRYTDFEWLELNVLWLVLFGNSYNRIRPNADSPFGSLEPLEPWRMRVVDQAADGGLMYRYTPAKGIPITLGESELLRFPGLSVDGVEGVKMYQLMRNVVGIALLLERHTSMFLSKGARVGGVLVPEQPLTQDQVAEVRDNFNKAVGGPDKTGVIAMLPFGMKLQPFQPSNKDSQLIELSDATVGQILRFIGVPGVVVGFADKTATYASADAFFEKGGIKHSVMPVCVRVERRCDHSLVYEADVSVKLNLDALLRANTTDRFAALYRATGRPWMTGNEARAIEDMNRSDQPDMDRVLEPANLTSGELEADTNGSTKPPRQATRVFEVPAPDPAEALRETQLERGRRLAVLAATRIVRRELVAIKDRVSLAARDLPGWRAWVVDYYGRHAETVAREMDISEDTARLYAAAQRDDLLASGLGAIESWEQTAVPKLAAMAFGE